LYVVPLRRSIFESRCQHVDRELNMSEAPPSSLSAAAGQQAETRGMLADTIDRRAHDIERRWLEKVREDGAATGREVPPTDLRARIGEYLVRLAGALRGGGSIESGGSAAWSEVAREQALTHVRLGFDIHQLVHEFILLRRILFEVAREDRLVTDALQSQRLADLIEAAIAVAVQSYVESRDAADRRARAEHIGFLTHELRNPLTTATMAATRLRRRPQLVDADRDTLDMLDRGLNRVRSMIDGILLTERLEARETECRPVDMTFGQVMPEATRAAEFEAKNKGIAFTTRYDPALEIHVDPTLALSALQNVIDNAVKFTDRGHVHVVVDDEPSEALVHVYDNCDGLPADQLHTIFEPFKRAHSGKAGTGLGLAIARRAVEAQGGRIGADSSVGQGCHFWLTFPKPKH
jgi:signal transduction histidine kinase